ncbi:MAG: nucleotidyltransferase domain-containing protein [Terracidiphilus sp.]
MQSKADAFSEFALRSLAKHPVGIECIEKSTAIVIFGSRASGLERADSDLDVLCIGGTLWRLKSRELDINMVPLKWANNSRWLGTELASHISTYGRWVKGGPEWLLGARISPEAVNSKRRRLAAFMRTLPLLWDGLLDEFRLKYAIKLRREAQRLLLLEQNVSIPPTRAIDCHWVKESNSPAQVENVLRRFVCLHSQWLVREFMPKIETTLKLQSQNDGRGGVKIYDPTPSKHRYWSKPLGARDGS